MHFVLYNRLFDLFLLLIYFTNIIITSFLFFKNLNKVENKEEKNILKITSSHTKVYKFMVFTVIIHIIILLVLVVALAYKFNFIFIFSLLFYLSFLLSALKNKDKDISSLSYENKADYINTILIYLIFFSYDATQIYINNFSNASHTIKEYLVLLFIFIKLVFFSYCIIINISIFASNIAIILNKRANIYIAKIKKQVYGSFEYKFYNFFFSVKYCNKRYYLIDIPLFFITCPFFLIYDFCMPILIIIARWIFEKALVFCKKVITYLNNSSKIISKTIKISSIISLLIVHWIMIYDRNYISMQTKEFYSLLITVILIPLIYDRIKS